LIGTLSGDGGFVVVQVVFHRSKDEMWRSVSHQALLEGSISALESSAICNLQSSSSLTTESPSWKNLKCRYWGGGKPQIGSPALHTAASTHTSNGIMEKGKSEKGSWWSSKGNLEKGSIPDSRRAPAD
jgi:hypothetical protein